MLSYLQRKGGKGERGELLGALLVEAARTVLLKRCQVRWGSTPGSDWLVAGNRNGEKDEGRRPERPSLPGSTSISRLVSTSASHQLCPGLVDHPAAGWALQTSSWPWHSFAASPRVSMHHNTATQAPLADPGHHTLSPAHPSSPPCPVLLPSRRCTRYPSRKECASPPPPLAGSCSSCGFRLSLDVPSARRPSLTPKVSVPVPFLCAPTNVPVFPSNTMWSIIARYLHRLSGCLFPFRP